MDGERFRQFWALVTEVWKKGVAGIDVGTLVTALAVFLVFYALRGLFTRSVLATLRRAVARTRTDIDDEVVAALAEPVRFVPIVIGLFLVTTILPLKDAAADFAIRLNRSLVAFVIFWALTRATGPLAAALHRLEGVLTRPMIEWIVKIARVAFIALGAAAILEIWGIAVGPIIAGLGLFGVAVALGAQDLFKNLIAGLFVLGERRFEPGDWILVDGIVEGTVEAIGFRTTTVRRFDKAPVYVPNSQLADRAVTNFSRMTYRRISWMLGLEYRTTIDQLRTVRNRIEALLKGDPAIVQPPEAPLFVHVDRFSDSAIDIMLYCFTRTTDWGEWLAIKERLALAIKRIVEEAGTSFAFPSRSLYLESWPAGVEPFPLPERHAAETAAETARESNQE